MTAGEKIRALLDERETRKEKPYNVTQLATATGKARESVSRRVNGQTAIVGEYPRLFAKALGIKTEELQAPAVEVVSLASVSRRLGELADLVAELNQLNRQALEALAARAASASQQARRRAGGTKR